MSEKDLYKRVPGQTKVDVYHGTSAADLEKIKREGLYSPKRLFDEKGEKTRNWPHFQYLHVSTKKADSEMYAKQSAAEEASKKKDKGYVQSCQDPPCDPVVLKATVPRGHLKATLHKHPGLEHLGRVVSGHIPPDKLSVVSGGAETPLKDFAFRRSGAFRDDDDR